MSTLIDDAFHIEWDLHELGPREHPTLVRQMSRADFARALAAGDLPANAELVDEEKAA
jgi:hypothetical protein